MHFPSVFLVRQDFPNRKLADIPATVHLEMGRSGFGARLKPGSRIAVGSGSRGISHTRKLPDTPAWVPHKVGGWDSGARLKPGPRITLGIGSRGIANIATVA